jgi:hypothetical protein
MDVFVRFRASASGVYQQIIQIVIKFEDEMFNAILKDTC